VTGPTPWVPREAYAALPSQRCAECLFDASGAGAKCLVAVSDISDGSINCGVVIFGDTDGCMHDLFPIVRRCFNLYILIYAMFPILDGFLSTYPWYI
jgi:hypothetical protein